MPRFQVWLETDASIDPDDADVDGEYPTLSDAARACFDFENEEASRSSHALTQEFVVHDVAKGTWYVYEVRRPAVAITRLRTTTLEEVSTPS